MLVDDKVTQGGTLADFIETAGGRVVAATALTSSSQSEKLTSRRDTIAALRFKVPGLEPRWQEVFGHDFNGHTRGEVNDLL